MTFLPVLRWCSRICPTNCHVLLGEHEELRIEIIHFEMLSLLERFAKLDLVAGFLTSTVTIDRRDQSFPEGSVNTSCLDLVLDLHD